MAKKNLARGQTKGRPSSSRTASKDAGAQKARTGTTEDRAAFVELGKLLKLGGMSDPWFIVGQVESMVRTLNEIAEAERRNTELLARVTDSYNRQLRSERCL